jgi:hypothetical protein
MAVGVGGSVAHAEAAEQFGTEVASVAAALITPRLDASTLVSIRLL